MSARSLRCGRVLGALGCCLVVRMAGAQAPVPEEPALVLPEYVLEIDDVEIDVIEAGVPEEADLLPPERTPPMPQGAELAIREPDIGLAPPLGDAAGVSVAGATFFVEGQVGAGTLHQLVSELSIYRPGAEPRFKLASSYDMRDGFGGSLAGAGFHEKSVDLEGSLELSSGLGNLSLDGAFHDRDKGLQGVGQAVYGSRILRRITAGVRGRLGVLPWLRFGAGLGTEATTLILTRTDPDPVTSTGYGLRPELSGEVEVGPLRAALVLAYGLAVDTGDPVGVVHRFSPHLDLAVDLPLHLTAEGTVGWHGRFPGSLQEGVSASDSHHVPFTLAITGTPADMLWLRFAGGYRVKDRDRADAMTEMDFTAAPQDGLVDERGWYAEALFRVSVLPSLILSGGVNFSLVQGELYYAEAADPLTGLYAVEQGDVERTGLGGSAGVLWDIVPGVSVRLDYRREFLGLPRFAPSDDLVLQGKAILAEGTVGAQVDARFALVAGQTPQVPVIDLGGFVRLTPNVRVVLEASDLLQPLTGGPRIGAAPPYVEAGFGASLRLQVSL